MTDKTTYLCPQCQIGHLQTSRMTYVRVVDGMVMSMPDTPAHTCDVCGYHEFDRSTVAHVDALVGNNRRVVNPSRVAAKAQPIDGKSTQGLKG